MGDAGEGLIDADARIQERMEELERERRQQFAKAVKNPEQLQALESLRLAKTELERQLESTANERRRTQIGEADDDADRRPERVTGAGVGDSPSSPIATVHGYHDGTKHHFHGFARSLGY